MLVNNDYYFSVFLGKHLRRSSILFLPSKLQKADFLELKGMTIRIVMSSGSSIERNESVCGHIGVTKVARTAGWVNEPFADSYVQLMLTGHNIDWRKDSKEKTCRVCCRTRRRRNAQSVRLDGCQVTLVAEQLEHGHVRMRAAVYNDIIQDVDCFARDGGIAWYISIQLLPSGFRDLFRFFLELLPHPRCFHELPFLRRIFFGPKIACPRALSSFLPV